jgi:transketolase
MTEGNYPDKFRDRLDNYPIHDSMRGLFGYHLYRNMLLDERVFLLTGDLGYKMFDPHSQDMPERFINCGASEQAMMGIACGLAMSGKIPFVYSITPFLLYRAYETIRNYVDHERLNVKLIGSGRNTDYAHDGFSHDASDAPAVLSNFKNIKTYFPTDKLEIEKIILEMRESKSPTFLSLSR